MYIEDDDDDDFNDDLDETAIKEFYVRKSFKMYDILLCDALGCNDVINVWENLFRFVWRQGTQYGNDCIARVRQKKLAEYTKLDRSTVCRYIGILESYGFIEKVGARERMLYRIGTWHKGQRGRVEEIYGESIVNHVYKLMEKWAKEKGYKSVFKVPGPERATFTLSVLDQIKIQIRSEMEAELVAQGNNPYGPAQQPSLSHATTLVVSDRNPCCTEPIQEVPNIEVANTEVTKDKSSKLEPLAIGFADSRGTQASSPPERSEGGLSDIGLSGYEQSHSEKTTSARPTRRVREAQEGFEDLIAANKRRLEDINAAKMKKTRDLDAKIKNFGGSKKSMADKEPDPIRRKLYKNLEARWESLYTTNFPGKPFGQWGGKEFGQVKQLLEKYRGEQIDALFDYVLSYWSNITLRLKNAPLVPTVGYVLSLHASFVPEAAEFAKHAGVLKELEEWKANNPGKTRYPDALLRRYTAAKKELEKLGLLRKA